MTILDHSQELNLPEKIKELVTANLSLKHFISRDTEIINKVKEVVAARSLAISETAKLAHSVRALRGVLMAEKLMGFVFEEKPKLIHWLKFPNRNFNSVFIPNENTRTGHEINKEMDKIKFPNVERILKGTCFDYQLFLRAANISPGMVLFPDFAIVTVAEWNDKIDHADVITLGLENVFVSYPRQTLDSGWLEITPAEYREYLDRRDISKFKAMTSQRIVE